jgi:hypothetical protein
VLLTSACAEDDLGELDLETVESQQQDLWGLSTRCAPADLDYSGRVTHADLDLLLEYDQLLRDCMDPDVAPEGDMTAALACVEFDYDGPDGVPDGVVGGPDFVVLAEELRLIYPDEDNHSECFAQYVEEKPECAPVDYTGLEEGVPDGVVGGPDFAWARQKEERFRSCFGMDVSLECAVIDFDDNGIIGIPDFAELDKIAALFEPEHWWQSCMYRRVSHE